MAVGTVTTQYSWRAGGPQGKTVLYKVLTIAVSSSETEIEASEVGYTQLLGCSAACGLSSEPVLNWAVDISANKIINGDFTDGSNGAIPDDSYDVTVWGYE